MIHKGIAVNEIGSTDVPADGRDGLWDDRRRTGAGTEKDGREVGNLLDKVQKIAKLHKVGKKNNIWSISKSIADPNSLYRGNTCLFLHDRLYRRAQG